MLNPPSAIAFKKIISFYSKDTLGDPKKSLQSTQTMNFIFRISTVETEIPSLGPKMSEMIENVGLL